MSAMTRNIVIIHDGRLSVNYKCAHITEDAERGKFVSMHRHVVVFVTENMYKPKNV